MKKIFKLFTAFVLLLGIVACDSSVTAKSLTLKPMPKTEYYVGEELEDFKVVVKFSDDTTKEFDKSNKDVKIEGFDTTTPGDKTLTIKYLTASITIPYKVSNTDEPEKLYTSGSGSVGDPYIISNAEELSNIRYNLNKHFKLNNDIDLDGVNWVPIGSVDVNYTSWSLGGSSYTINLTGSFTGELDGNDKRIFNFNTVSNLKKSTGATDKELYYGLFYGLKGATIKDLTVEVDINDNVSLGVGTIAGYATGFTLDNVHTKGKIKAIRAGGLISQIKNDDNTVQESLIKNSTNEIDITVFSNKDYKSYGKIGGLVDQIMDKNNLTVENSKNFGDLIQEKGDTGSIIGPMISYQSGSVEITVDGFTHIGKIIGNEATTITAFVGYKYSETGIETEIDGYYSTNQGVTSNILLGCSYTSLKLFRGDGDIVIKMEEASENIVGSGTTYKFDFTQAE